MQRPALAGPPSQPQTTPPAFSTIGMSGTDVERFEPGFRHDVDLPQGQHAVGIAIAAEPAHADGVREPVEANLILALEHIRGGRSEERLIEARARPSFAALQTLGSAIPGCAIVIPEPLADEGLIHEAEQRLALILKADERAPKRHSEDERPRSIDGIERPDIVCAGIQATPLQRCHDRESRARGSHA